MQTEEIANTIGEKLYEAGVFPKTISVAYKIYRTKEGDLTSGISISVIVTKESDGLGRQFCENYSDSSYAYEKNIDGTIERIIKYFRSKPGTCP